MSMDLAEYDSLYGDRRSRRVVVDFSNAISKTKQSFRELCNINTIIAKYNHTGLISHVNKREAVYGDVSNVPDYQAAMNIVNTAHDVFSSLPSDLRARFSNDPAKYLEFVSDPSNVEEAVKLGLFVKKEVPKEVITKVHVVGSDVPAKPVGPAT